MKGILLCEHLADLDVHGLEGIRQEGMGKLGCLTEEENLRGHIGRGRWGDGTEGQSPGEADPGTLGPCRERQTGSLVTEEHLKSWRVQCAFRSSLLLCPPSPLCSEDLWLWVWESWLLMERKGQIAWAVTACHTQKLRG